MTQHVCMVCGSGDALWWVAEWTICKEHLFDVFRQLAERRNCDRCIARKHPLSGIARVICEARCIECARSGWRSGFVPAGGAQP